MLVWLLTAPLIRFAHKDFGYFNKTIFHGYLPSLSAAGFILAAIFRKSIILSILHNYSLLKFDSDKGKICYG
jgi:hypothetical protein